ncbi:MAG: hypothetical protein Q9211_001865 [Gyalolechia sp. 1 TL-2023]
MAAPVQKTHLMVVKPVDRYSMTLLRHQHNSDRLRYYSSTGRLGSSYHVRKFPKLELHLQFDPPPPNITRGFIFGRDEEQCDVVLAEIPDENIQSAGYAISETHFRIDFNWESGLPRLVNLSSKIGTVMLAPSLKRGGQLLGYNEMAFLNLTEHTTICIHGFRCEVSFPTYGNHQQQHTSAWQEFGEKPKNLLSSNEQPNNRSSQDRQNRYRCVKWVDSDKTGAVYKVSDLAGKLYVAKTSYSSGRWDVKDYLQTVRYRDIRHEHIATFLDTFCDGHGAEFIVVDYMPFGNLTHLDEISPHELSIILRQSLHALQYLHDEKRMTHHNITPSNILVHSRPPSLKIKLGDFCLPMQAECSMLKSFYGVPQFDAPEGFLGQAASPPADIWSLAAVACAVTNRLPEYSVHLRSEEWANRMCDAIQTEANGLHDPVVPLLKEMLSLNPLDRPSARGCLSHRSLQQYTSVENMVESKSGLAKAWPQDFTFGVSSDIQPSRQALAGDPKSSGRPANKQRFSSSPDHLESLAAGPKTLPKGSDYDPKVCESDIPYTNRTKSKVIKLRLKRLKGAGIDPYRKTRANSDQGQGDESPQFAPPPSPEELDKLRHDVHQLQIATGGEGRSRTRKRGRSPTITSDRSSQADDEMC